MPDAYETGAIFSSGLPEGQRTYYEALLMETLRTKSILVPFTTVKEDFRARDTGIIKYSEVMDSDPDFNSLSESGIWLPGAHLDSRSVQIELTIHGDVIKISDYNELVNYWANGDLRGLVQGKLGQNQVDYLDILARNAFLSAPSAYVSYANSKARFTLLATDVFDPDYAELIRTHLEEREVPGVAGSEDGAGQTVVCTTTPRVIHDVRTAAGSKWLEVQEYMGTNRKFTAEVGMWGGVRFIKTRRLELKNYGLVDLQTDLDGATVAGQGAAATVDVVYSVGQTGSTRFITVTDTTGFTAGEIVTIHSQTVNVADGSGGFAPSWADGTQEERKIVEVIDGTTMSLDRPLMKPHLSGDYVTRGVALHASIFHGGPSVVYAIGERPNVYIPPKIDDLGMINRFAWRGFLKFQQFRPEFTELMFSGGSVN